MRRLITFLVVALTATAAGFAFSATPDPRPEKPTDWSHILAAACVSGAAAACIGTSPESLPETSKKDASQIIFVK